MRCAAPSLGDTATAVGAATRLELWRCETDQESPTRQLTTDYRQVLLDDRAWFPTRHFPELPDVAKLGLPVAVVHLRIRPAAADRYPWQMAPRDPPPGWPHALPQNFDIGHYDLDENDN